MKKLHKNFRALKQTVESMTCSCGCGCGPCTCSCPDVAIMAGFPSVYSTSYTPISVSFHIALSAGYDAAH